MDQQLRSTVGLEVRGVLGVVGQQTSVQLVGATFQCGTSGTYGDTKIKTLSSLLVKFGSTILAALCPRQ
jgi:hypothetical protein